jgi:hypothetical protein
MGSAPADGRRPPGPPIRVVPAGPKRPPSLPNRAAGARSCVGYAALETRPDLKSHIHGPDPISLPDGRGISRFPDMTLTTCVGSLITGSPHEPCTCRLVRCGLPPVLVGVGTPEAVFPRSHTRPAAPPVNASAQSHSLRRMTRGTSGSLYNAHAWFGVRRGRDLAMTEIKERTPSRSDRRFVARANHVAGQAATRG